VGLALASLAAAALIVRKKRLSPPGGTKNR